MRTRTHSYLARVATYSFVLIAFFLSGAAAAPALEPIPEKLVVLTFDDSVKSHFTVVRPILTQYGFGATFFITEGFDFKTNKRDYMTWKQIVQLNRDGFEIGNHTRDHMGASHENLPKLAEQIAAINDRCQENEIPRPTSFAYPGNATDHGAFEILQKAGINFARRGGAPEYPYEAGQGFAYEPGLDHPLLIPSAGDARPDWTLDNFRRAVSQAKHGRIVVLQFHGVPDGAHPWVHTPREKFEQYMRYLAVNKFRVIAMRDLARYVDARLVPRDPDGVIKDRQQGLAKGKPRKNYRAAKDDLDLRRWLENMIWHHRFTTAEIGAATGMQADEIEAAKKRFGIRADNGPNRKAGAPLLVAPYPGGRHPRIGFLEGAIRPQRDTKASVFTPWDSQSYVVVDLPEAIWMKVGDGRRLLYLAHTHIDTVWSAKGVELAPVEWQRLADGSFKATRVLPNDVEFGTHITPDKNAVRMEMWIRNGTKQTLRGLRVQNCVMLKGAPEFAQMTVENKVDRGPYVACRSPQADRWVITAWQHCERAWSNAPCPCMHSDPQFPDCPPGETKRLQGWLSFYEGTDIQAEFDRIEATRWRD